MATPPIEELYPHELEGELRDYSRPYDCASAPHEAIFGLGLHQVTRDGATCYELALSEGLHTKLFVLREMSLDDILDVIQRLFDSMGGVLTSTVRTHIQRCLNSEGHAVTLFMCGMSFRQAVPVRLDSVL